MFLRDPNLREARTDSSISIGGGVFGSYRSALIGIAGLGERREGGPLLRCEEPVRQELLYSWT